MTSPQIVIVIAMNLFFGICGWLCLFKTDMLASMGRRNYERSKFARLVPHPTFALKPWYPTFLRCAGVFIWLCAALFDFVAFKGRFH